MSTQWSDRWAYTMITRQAPTEADTDGDGIIDQVVGPRPVSDMPGQAPGEAPVDGDTDGDGILDYGGDYDSPHNGDQGVPGMGWDVVNDGDPETVQPPAPAPQAPTTPAGSCPVGYRPNPNYNPNQANLRAAGGVTTRQTEPPCVPMNTTSGGGTNKPTNTGTGFDANCNAVPKPYPAPVGCIPKTGADESVFFKEQQRGCLKEWKVLERLEEEVKARYEQLCMAREKFNQRQERYGGMCGPYELMYGITEAKEKEARAKKKAQQECLEKKNHGTGGCSSGGCGCASKTSTGCGCGCSGGHSEGHSDKTKMDYEYTDPLKSACKRAVEESFAAPAKKVRVTPPRAAKKSSCMPCAAAKKKTTKKRTVRKLRKPAKTTTTLPKCGKRKTRS